MKNDKEAEPLNIPKLGGEAIKEKYGTAHFGDLGKKSYAAHLAKDPDYGKKLAAAGLHGQEVKRQKKIRSMIVEKKPTVKHSLLSVLLGKNGS